MRLCLVVLGVVLAWVQAAPPAFKLAVVGLPTIVWNQTRDACPGLNKFGHVGEQPDSMPEAWHDPLSNMSYLIAAVNWGTYPSVGSTLDHVVHNCSREVYTAINNTTPQSYENHQWLQSTRMYPDGSGAALIHNEFHGEQEGIAEYCSFDHKTSSGQCILWSTDLGTTRDGGSRWELTHAPLFTLPRKYIKDGAIAGFGALGKIMEVNGVYYGHVYRSYRNNTGAGPPNTVGSGICAWRSTNLSDPSSFSLWNGTAFAVPGGFNPYKNPPVPPSMLAAHTCASLDFGGVSTSHVQPRRVAPTWRPAGFPSHVLLMLPNGGKAARASYAFLPDGALDGPGPFTQWGPPQDLDLSGWLDPHTLGGGGEFMYPTLLDHSSPFSLSQGGDSATLADGLSYALVGNSTLYLYAVLGRHYIVRFPVAFFPTDQPTPLPPFAPLPPNPEACLVVRVSGAGLAGVDGDYARDAATQASFTLDATHKLYLIDGHWHLADPTVAVYYTATADASTGAVPTTGWTPVTGPPPYPVAQCVKV